MHLLSQGVLPTVDDVAAVHDELSAAVQMLGVFLGDDVTVYLFAIGSGAPSDAFRSGGCFRWRPRTSLMILQADINISIVISL